MGLNNGMYVARSTTSPHFSLVLRVDIDPDDAQKGFVSGDLYEGFLADNPTFDSDSMKVGVRFMGSFRSDPLQAGDPAFGAPKLDVSLIGVAEGMGQLDLALRPVEGSESWLVQYQGTSVAPEVPAGPLEFVARRRQDEFHDLMLEIDAAPNFPLPTTITVHGHGGPFTMFDCFRRAGFRLIPSMGDSPIPAHADGSGWSMDQLKTFYLTKPNSPAGEGFFNRQQGLSLSVYQMIVSRQQDDPNNRITGAMFQESRRAWCAVYYESLQTQFDRDGSAPEELGANFLFTAVHEVGHCLNLPHAFEAAAAGFGITPRFATFMNYPQRYLGDKIAQFFPNNFVGASGWDDTQLDNYRKFWSMFEFAFIPQELLLLRHGDRRDLLVPGSVDDPTDLAGAYRGEFAANLTAMAFGGQDGAGMELVLRVRGNRRAGSPAHSDRPGDDPAHVPVFEFGEPVVIEARLRNLVNVPRAVDRPLSVMTGDLQVSYRTPDGRYLNYEPPAALCTLSSSKPFDGNPRTPEPDACYKDVCLTASSGGTGVWAPGRYLVRAAYRHGDTLLVSNVLALHVRYPDRQTEDLVVPLMDEDVGSYLSFRGVFGMPGADRRLSAAFKETDDQLRTDVTHPLLAYYAAYEARLRANDTLTIDPVTRQAKSAYTAPDALKWYRQAFGLSDLAELRSRRAGGPRLPTSPFSNIALAKIGRSFYDELKEARENKLAAGLASSLHKTLEERGVPPTVCEKYLPPRPAASRSGNRPDGEHTSPG